MGRELKRVPLDFDYPLNKVWYGYYLRPSFCHSEFSAGCEGCKEFARITGVPVDGDSCPDFDSVYSIQPNVEPPTGEGYQLWETTSEGSPTSPVFKTLDGLCEWCEGNATTFASFKATKERWKSMLDDGMVAHREGNVIFI